MFLPSEGVNVTHPRGIIGTFKTNMASGSELEINRILRERMEDIARARQRPDVQAYQRDLDRAVAEAILPALREERASNEVLDRAEGITLHDEIGEVAVGREVLLALRDAQLLTVARISTIGQLEDAGWKDIRTNPRTGEITRIAGYYLEFPPNTRALLHGVWTMGIIAGYTQRGKSDFTSWKLIRQPQ